MNSKLNFKRFLKKFHRRSTVLRDPELMHPIREWSIGLGVALVLLTGAAGLGTYTYIKNQSVETGPFSEIADSVVYRESIVTAVLGEMEARAAKISTTPKRKVEDSPTEDKRVEVSTSTEETVVIPEPEPIAPALGDG